MPTNGSLVTSPTALLLVAATGTLAGIAIARRLAARRYRRPEERSLPITFRGWVTPVTALASVAMWWSTATDTSVLVPATFVVCAWVMVGLAAIDLDVHRLPDVIQLPAYPALLVLLGACSVATGDLGALWRAALAGAAMFALFFALVLMAPAGGMGFGDVKLAGLLGLMLGWLGWRYATVATLGTFILGGLVAAALLLSGRTDRRGEFAYGPVMVASALTTIVLLHTP